MTIFECLTRPEPFQRGTVNFWNEPHISKQLLKAHLDPESEGASRRPDFIDRSVDWITSVAPPNRYPVLLDIGCGPGLYAERLYDRGYRVTGIDFSRRSIDYAIAQASQAKHAIDFHYCDYLDMEYFTTFDLIVLIYCDYGALSPQEASTLLTLIHNALRKGGKLIIDVFTLTKLARFQEKRLWSYHDDGGFWRPDAYFSIQADCIYDECTTLEQTVVISQNSIQPFYIWHRYFTQHSLNDEFKKAKFMNPVFFGDIAGQPYSSQSETMAAIVEKL